MNAAGTEPYFNPNSFAAFSPMIFRRVPSSTASFWMVSSISGMLPIWCG